MKKIIAVFFILLLSGCVPIQGVQYTPTSLATAPNKNEEHQPTETILPTQQAPAKTVTLQLEDEQVTPIPERIIRDATCDDSAVKGHILFIHVENNLENLYVMDGNGCNSRLLMEDVSGSPAWSIDGNWAATGCEGGKAICILSTESILETCYNPEGICKPEIVKKITISDSLYFVAIGQLSWSHDGEQLLVEVVGDSSYAGISLLNLEENKWQNIIDGGMLNSELSPTKDYLIFTTGFSIYGLPLDHVLLKDYVSGQNAIFSPDGKRITFLAKINEDDKEPYGIMEWDEETLPIVQMIYNPVRYDENWNMKNVLLIEPSEYRVLSWSPDDQYLAFLARNKILRLDKETGEAVLLSANLDFGAYDKFQGLAWGP